MQALANLYKNNRKADTLAELEVACVMPPGALTSTLGRYNAAVAAGSDDEFRKNSKFLRPLSRAPYYAINLDLARAYLGCQLSLAI